MPRGPQGQGRPEGPIACAVYVGRIATGEIRESYEAPKRMQKRASKGGKARTAVLTPERRKEIAKTAAVARWKGNQDST